MVALSSSTSLRRLVVVCFGVGAALVTLGACGRERAEHRALSGETLGKSSQELREQAEHYVGAGHLPAKQLALTFDDGPGTRTSELSTYLRNEGIRAVFFVNGACIEATSLPNESCPTPTPNAGAILAQLTADGHLVANHTTTHRDITGVPTDQRVRELSETDALIVTYGKTPWNRSLFRAPFGSWSAAVRTTVSASAMSHYVGPIYWDIGGDSDRYPDAAADWACFQGALKQGNALVHSAPNDPLPDGYATSHECGDAYRAEIGARGSGIVLMHDPYAWSQNGASGSTVDMVAYLVPLLKADGYTFVRADEIPLIAADFPACGSADCVTCSGPAVDQCTSCTADRYLSGGACVACSTCAPGTFLSAACTATTDAVCSPCHASCSVCSGPDASQCSACATGFYLAEGACQACTVCAAGTSTVTACAPNANTVCASCAPGTYASDPGAATCTSCGRCDDGDPCTTDTCSPTIGCTHAPIAGCEGSPDAPGSPDVPDGSIPEDAPDAASRAVDGGTARGATDGDSSGCQVGRRSSTPPLSWAIGAIGAVGLALVRRRRTP